MVLGPYHLTATSTTSHGAPQLISAARSAPFATWRYRTWLHDLALRRRHGPLLAGPTRRIARQQVAPLFVRGKKTKSTVRLSDLPQGAIPVPMAQPAEEEQSAPVYPTVIQQARRNMRKFDNCVLLTRVGGFYELYFEHAEEYGPLLHLKIAQKKTSAGPVPMVTSCPLSPSCMPPYPEDRRHPLVISSDVSNISLPPSRRGSPSSSWTGSLRSLCRI